MLEQNITSLVEKTFLDALELPYGDRANFLANACHGDDALQRRVVALLEANAGAGGNPEEGSLPTTMFRHAAGLTLLATAVEVLPIRLERYDLICRIGEGSFGVVYRAVQRSPVRRDVAVKVLRPGMDSKLIIRRFDFEKQVLAGLEHANIACLFDAGNMPDGRPYFVMELIEGPSLTDYCDRNHLSLRLRLGLYLDVCAAVAHAHRRAILHRDLKPSNILVHEHEGCGTVKIIDFGIARAIGNGGSSGTLATEAGRMLGTPEYMSPEQFYGETDHVDTRSDVYALGVLLYELLCGRLPFCSEQLRTSSAKMQRLICQIEPPRPSAAWEGESDGLVTVAANRSASVEDLQAMLSKELEWIPLKALRKEPIERYGSVTELADDVRNYLAGLPLRAGPQTFRYRARKFVSRHRMTVMLTMLLIVSILAGSIAGTIALHRARIAEGNARRDQLAALNSAAMLHLQQANACLLMGRPGQASAHLETARDQLTQLKGALWIADLALWDLARQASPPVVQWKISEKLVADVEFLADGTRAVAISEVGTVELLDLRWGKPIHVHQIAGYLSRLKLSGDRRVAFLTDMEGSLFQWEMDATPPTLIGRNIGTLLAVDADGSHSLHAKAGRISLRDTALRALTHFASPGTVLDGAFLADGRFLTCGKEGSRLQLWDASRPIAPVWAIDVGTSAPRMALSPDGSRIAVADGEALLICNLAAKTVEKTLRGHKQQISGIGWAHDSSKVYSAAWDGSCRAWDANTGEQVGMFFGPPHPLSSLSVSADGRRIVCGGWDGWVYAWGAGGVPAEVRFKHQEKTRWPPTAAFACDDDLIAIGEAITPIVLYDRRTGMRLTDLGSDSRTSGVCLGGTQTELVYGGFDGTAVVHDLTAGHTVASLGQKLSPEKLAAKNELQVYCIRAENAPRALLWRRENELIAWDLATRKPIRTLATSDLSWQMDISPDGKLAMAFLNKASKGLGLYDVDSPFEQFRPNNGGLDGKASCAFSSNGEFLLTRRDHHEAFATIWKTSDLTELRRIPDGDNVITSDQFWPNDDHLLSFQATGDALLRDLGSGEDLYTFHDMGISLAGSGARYRLMRHVGNDMTICDFTWPVRRRALQPAIVDAMARIAKGEESADALLTVGKWFALHAVDDWAIDCLTHARELGAVVDPIELATCHVRLGNKVAAAEEYARALKTGGHSPARETFLKYAAHRNVLDLLRLAFQLL